VHSVEHIPPPIRTNKGLETNIPSNKLQICSIPYKVGEKLLADPDAISGNALDWQTLGAYICSSVLPSQPPCGQGRAEPPLKPRPEFPESVLNNCKGLRRALAKFFHPCQNAGKFLLHAVNELQLTCIEH
jgi:hypothetical protein